MNARSTLAVLTALAAPVLANSNSEPRTPRAIPLHASEKPAAAEQSQAPYEPLARAGTETASSAPAKSRDADSGRARTSRAPLDRVHYTTQPDGTTWASGNTYKARFGPDGATYVPFLGGQAPRNFPLELSLDWAGVDGAEVTLTPAASAVRDGDRIVIDRGPIDEVYELGLESVEQTFVVAERPGAGDLTLRVRLASEMTRSEDADGFVFANEHGSVRYGRAFVREAGGNRIPLASRAVDGGVEIVVDREYLAQATFPLVVDPVVTTYATYVSGEDTLNSDVAYDVTTDRTLTVFEYNFSQTDGDVFAILREGNGSASYFSLLDNTVENWRGPKCANLNLSDQFLVAAQVSNVTGLPDWNIWGMTVSATTLVNSSKFLISTPDQGGPKFLADVGGDGYDGPGASYYCVTWRRDFSVNDWDIHARLVTAQGTLVGSQTLMIDNSGLTRDSMPSISKSNGLLGGGAAWTITWQREVSATSHHVYAARVSWDGIMLNGPTQLTTGTSFHSFPRVSSPQNDGRVLIVFAIEGTDDDLYYLLVNGTTYQAAGSLSAMDAGATIEQDQIDHSVDSDGERFVVAYAESYGSSTFDYDIWISTFVAFGNDFGVTEKHQSLDFSTAQARRTDIVAKRSGGLIGSRRFFVTYDSTSGTDRDILGGVYDRPTGGLHTPFCVGYVVGCPCNNHGTAPAGCGNSQNSNGALLVADGVAATGPEDSLALSVSGVPATSPCTLYQGTAGNQILYFGDGTACVSGAVVRIGTKAAVAGSATWGGSESDISVTGGVPLAGALRFYQVAYRNVAAFCTSDTFNISNGMLVLWLP